MLSMYSLTDTEETRLQVFCLLLKLVPLQVLMEVGGTMEVGTLIQGLIGYLIQAILEYQHQMKALLEIY